MPMPKVLYRHHHTLLGQTERNARMANEDPGNNLFKEKC